MIRLLLGSKIGSATMYPWRMQAKMLINSVTRVMFIVLLTASLAIGAFKWNWIWITPPVLAILLNLRNARKVPDHTPLDMLHGRHPGRGRDLPLVPAAGLGRLLGHRRRWASAATAGPASTKPKDSPPARR